MKGIVWGKTLERACDKLNNIAENYIILGYKITKERITKTQKSILFDNGDYWLAIYATESSARGRRCNVSYVDHELKRYITIIEQIRACTRSMPYNGVTIF